MPALNKDIIKVKCTLFLPRHIVAHLDRNYAFDAEVAKLVKRGMRKNPYLSNHKKIGILNSTYASWKQRGVELNFTKDEFVNHFIQDQRFNTLFKTYKKSNFDKKLKPSFTPKKNLHNIHPQSYEDRLEELSLDKGRQVYDKQYKIAYSSIKKAAFDVNTNMTTLKKLIEDPANFQFVYITKKEYLKLVKKNP